MSPSQFHRESAAAKKVSAILASRERSETGYMSEMKQLEDPEHINFPTGEILSLRLGKSKDLVKDGDTDMLDLFSSFEHMNFSPIAAGRRRK